MEKEKQRDNYIDKVLDKCKLWDGLFVHIDDLKAAISGKSDKEWWMILRHEITFQ